MPILPSRPADNHVLATRNFRLYWLGQVVSLTGTWMQVVAEGWVVLQLTGSVASLGFVSFAFGLPGLVFALIGGAAADRGDRRRIALATQIVLMTIALAMAALIVAHALSFWIILGASLLGGIASAYDLPARQALIPQLVAPSQIPQAIAYNQIAFHGSRMLGPALAGFTIEQFGLASAYLCNGLSFLAAIGGLMLIRVPARVPGPARHGSGSTGAAVREGLAYVGGSRVLRALLALSALTVLLVFPALAVVMQGYVAFVLRGDASTVGTLMAVSGATAMAGAFLMLRVPPPRRGHAILACVAIAAISLVSLVATHTTWIAACGIGMLASSFTLLMGLSTTTIQEIVPDALRGRVMSVAGLTFTGVLPFAALAAGALVERFGFAAVYLASAGLYLTFGLAIVLRSGIVGSREP